MEARYGIDSCVFIALAENEEGRAEHVRELFRSAESGEFRLLVSTIAFAEVLGVVDLEALLNAPFVDLAGADVPTIRRAGELRREMRGDNRRLSVPDAIHLATALEWGAEKFVTYDEKLLKLNGHVFSGASGPITIQRPHEALTQGRLDLG